MSRPRLSPVTWAAVVLIGVAVVAVVVAIASDRFDNWAPNVATEAFAIAATITVVERIVRRENQRLVQPRVGRAMRVLVFAVEWFARQCVLDYAVRHADADTSNLPEDPLEFLALWQEEYKTTSNPRIPRALMSYAGEFVERVQRIAEADRDLLPADVVVAADNVSQSFGGFGPSFAEHLEGVAGRPGGEDWLGLVVVGSARDLGDALRRHGAI
jgi:hypothetical protein